MLLMNVVNGLFVFHWLTLLHLSKSAFIPLYEALVRPHFQYGVPACSPNFLENINHLERIQIVATRLETGIRHHP